MNTPLTFAVVAAIVAALPATSMADRRLRLEFRRRRAHQRASSQPLSGEAPRVDPHRRMLPYRNPGYKPSDDANYAGNTVLHAAGKHQDPWGQTARPSSV